MLGKDVKRNEYWFFKEELSKIFVKQIEKPDMMELDEGAEDLANFQEERVNWFYYDEEDELQKLMDSLNPKGIREKKL